MSFRLTLCALALTATAAGAQPMLVTNPEICALAPDAYFGELGMKLTAGSMEEIEYFCEFDPPVVFDWTGDHTLARVGYCSEPGFISPEVFAFQFGAFEPGVV